MIREMTSEDLDKVASLYRDANQFTCKKAILKWTRAGLQKFPAYHLVYEASSGIEGAISGVLSGKKEATIMDISVSRDCRNRKIGTRLIRELLKRFEKDGIKTARLWVHWTDARAIPFYYKHGFEICGFEKTRNRPDVPDGEDLIHMKKELKPEAMKLTS